MSYANQSLDDVVTLGSSTTDGGDVCIGITLPAEFSMPNVDPVSRL